MTIDPALQQLWAYWCARRGDAVAPGFDIVDQAALGPVADRVLVVRREGPRFRYINVGATVRSIYGYPMEGLFLDIALPPDRREAAIQRYALACDSGRPLLSRNGYEVSRNLRFVVDRLILPLANVNGTIGGVICGHFLRSAGAGATLGAQTLADPAEDRLEFLEIPQPAPRLSSAG